MPGTRGGLSFLVRVHRNSVQSILEASSPHMWPSQEESGGYCLESHGHTCGNRFDGLWGANGKEWIAALVPYPK